MSFPQYIALRKVAALKDMQEVCQKSAYTMSMHVLVSVSCPLEACNHGVWRTGSAVRNLTARWRELS